MIKRVINSSEIHRLQIDNGAIADSKLIEDHILDFYRNFYAESNSNGSNTSSKEDFIGSYIPEMFSSEENIMLTKCSDYLEIKRSIFNLNGNSASGSDDFGVFFIILVGRLLG